MRLSWLSELLYENFPVKLFLPLIFSLMLHVGLIALAEELSGAPGGKAKTAHQPAPKILLVSIPRTSTTNETVRGSPTESHMPDIPAMLSPRGAGTFPSPYYFTPEELSEKPQTVAPVDLSYPDDAPFVFKNRVVLRLLINEHGSVDRVVVEDSNVPKELQSIAITAFSNSRFRPGFRNNTPVKSQLLLEILFEADSPPLQTHVAPTPRANALKQ